MDRDRFATSRREAEIQKEMRRLRGEWFAITTAYHLIGFVILAVVIAIWP